VITPQHSWNEHPVLPFIRLCYRFKETSFFQGERRLLDYLFLYMEEGRYLLTVEGIEYELLPGDFALIQPGMLFTTRGYGRCVVPNTHLDFFYNPNRERSFVTTPGQTNLEPYSELQQPRLNDFPNLQLPIKLKPRHPDQFKELLSRMIEHFNNNDIHNVLHAQKLAMELLLLLIGDFETTGSLAFEDQQFVTKMKAFISFHLSGTITVESMAKHAGYSESHFNVIFHHSFGATPHQYIVNLRLEKASELLAATGLKLDLIAEYCGFANASHFSKAFKKRYGLSPRHFRNAQSKSTLC